VTAKRWPLLAVILCAAMLLAGAACAAAGKSPGGGTGLGGTGEVILIAQVVLLLLLGRGLGEIMQRFGQPAVIGQLLAGLILGPSLFGWLWPEAHTLIFPSTPAQKGLINGISNMGVMMLLLLTGMETDLKLVRTVGRPAVTIAGAGVAVPFACGFALGEFLPASLIPDPTHRLVAALFLGTALSISSIKIVAMVVREMNFMRRNLGQIIVASAILEDTIGWIIVSITLGIAGAGGFSAKSLATTVIGTAIFLVLSYTVGRKLVFWLIRWVNDTFLSEYAVVTAILILMCVTALITQAIGVNTVLGAFVAGVLVGESPILSQHIEDQLRGFITAFMMPIFFGLSGLSADLTILKDPQIALLTLGLVAVASIGKFGGAFLGGELGGLSARESLALGCGMNARGSTEVIVASIGIAMGALSNALYSMIVTMAVITTSMMPPMLRWGLRRIPIRPEEEARLEKEGIDAKGLVGQLERLLIAADGSANGRLASRFAGFLAGQRGMPITVMHVNGAEDAPLTDIATEGAKQGHRAAKSGDAEASPPQRVEVSARVEKTAHEAVVKEAPKGYGLLFIGLDPMQKQGGSFSVQVDRAAAEFDGPLVLAFAGSDESIAEDETLNILVPLNGTEPSRRGMEMALAISSPDQTTITALNVPNRKGQKGAARRKAESSLRKDVTALARRYGHGRIPTAIRADTDAHTAIVEEAKRARCSLIVIGTGRRVGDHLYLGETVSAVLAGWKGALLVVVT
jgi:K+:H+ antiporter